MPKGPDDPDQHRKGGKGKSRQVRVSPKEGEDVASSASSAVTASSTRSANKHKDNDHKKRRAAGAEGDNKSKGGDSKPQGGNSKDRSK